MAASVRIEDEAFSDRRYDVLAACLGLPDADCARGKMAAAWRQCTAQQTHTLSTHLVVAILGPKGPDALITASLGEQVEGGIRIKGTAGRIEWLARLRENAVKGGKGKSAKRQAVGRHLAAENECAGVPDACPPTPAPTLSSPSEKAPPKPKTPRKEPDGTHHEFVRAFGDAWFARYGETYPFVGGKDGTAVRWFREQVGDDLDRFRSVVRTYLEDTSQFIVDARHSIGNLRAQWVRWAVKPPPGHTPRSGLMDQFRANAEIFHGSGGDDHDADRVHKGYGVLDGG